MATEIRDFGDKKTIVVFTDDNSVFGNLRDSRKCLKVIPYEQEQSRKVRMVGADLYFPKKYKGWLEKKIRGLGA